MDGTMPVFVGIDCGDQVARLVVLEHCGRQAGARCAAILEGLELGLQDSKHLP